MDVKTAFFYLFATGLLLASFRVITARNPVHAVLFLVLAFFQAAGIWLLLEAEFLAIALVLVYVGAVMVLFLFVVMMLDIHLSRLREGFWRHFPLAALIGVGIALEMIYLIKGGMNNRMSPIGHAGTSILTPSQATLPLSNTKELGILLYTEYLYPVQIAAVILLVAIVAAIALTLRGRKDSKHQAVSEQVRVKASDRLQVIKMAAQTRNSDSPQKTQ